jgi:hypothetical protein
MTQRTRTSVLTFAMSIGLAAAPAVAFAGPGFVVPSRNTTCGLLTAKQAGSRGPGLFCASSYIPAPNAESMGGVGLNHAGAARKISVGNDDGLYIGGYVDDNHRDKRPVLAYGQTWTRDGYTCTSRSTGLTCKRGAHGFFLSRQKQNYF